MAKASHSTSTAPMEGESTGSITRSPTPAAGAGASRSEPSRAMPPMTSTKITVYLELTGKVSTPHNLDSGTTADGFLAGLNFTKTAIGRSTLRRDSQRLALQNATLKDGDRLTVPLTTMPKKKASSTDGVPRISWQKKQQARLEEQEKKIKEQEEKIKEQAAEIARLKATPSAGVVNMHSEKNGGVHVGQQNGGVIGDVDTSQGARQRPKRCETCEEAIAVVRACTTCTSSLAAEEGNASWAPPYFVSPELVPAAERAIDRVAAATADGMVPKEGTSMQAGGVDDTGGGTAIMLGGNKRKRDP